MWNWREKWNVHSSVCIVSCCILLRMLVEPETSAQCFTLVIFAHNYLSKLYRAPKETLYFNIFHLQNFWDPIRNIAFGDENNMKQLGKTKKLSQSFSMGRKRIASLSEGKHFCMWTQKHNQDNAFLLNRNMNSFNLLKSYWPQILNDIRATFQISQLEN